MPRNSNAPLETTPRPAEPRLLPTRDEPTRRFERWLGLSLVLLAGALLARGLI